MLTPVFRRLKSRNWKSPYRIAFAAASNKTQHMVSFHEYNFTKVLYMSSSFWLLGVESRDFSHAEKESTACKAEQMHKITNSFTQNNNPVPF